MKKRWSTSQWERDGSIILRNEMQLEQRKLIRKKIRTRKKKNNER